MGQKNIGKSYFYNLLLNRENTTEYDPTIGVSYYTLDKYFDYIRYKCKFWDTGGGNTFQILLETYLKGSDACILFFDFRRSDTLKFIANLIEQLYEIKPDIVIIAVGFNYNHSELSDLPLVTFVANKKYLDKLNSYKIPVIRLNRFNQFEVKKTFDKVMAHFLKICLDRNIRIKDKEPSFSEEIKNNDNKSWFLKIKDLLCCSCCFIA